ncbi:MAG: DUF4115 domain-containing protein, partial [Acidobacteriales bacterium]|nr:DUF4115 domain-containing protein [Terriglobales bacterium]
RALEDERFDQLPGGIFNKGFIRAYARYLTIDEDQAVADYLAAAESEESDKDITASAPHPESFPYIAAGAPEDVSIIAQLPWGFFAIALLCIAIGFTLWGFHSRSLPGPPALKSSDTSHSSSTASSNPASKNPMPVSPVNETHTTFARNAPDAALAARLVVRLKARENSWVSISEDGKQVMQDILPAGAERSFSAMREVEVKSGNVGALIFWLNDRELPAQGQTQEVKTLIFDAHGVHVSQPVPAGPR